MGRGQRKLRPRKFIKAQLKAHMSLEDKIEPKTFLRGGAVAPWLKIVFTQLHSLCLAVGID